MGLKENDKDRGVDGMIEFARVLYGSQNYGLDGADSDRDTKVLLCPAFEDFYRYHKVDKGDLPDGCDPEHDSPMSVTRFHELLVAGNPNCVEMLFSVDLDVKVNGFGAYLDMMRQVYAGGYAAWVWDRFYSALMGLALNRMDRNGVTPKTVARARYFYELALYVAGNGFVIDENTWRDVDGKEAPRFHALAQALRFHPPMQEFLDRMADDLRAAFSGNRETLSEKAMGFCVKNWRKMADVRASAELLGVTLRDLVFMETQKEAWERCANRDYKGIGIELIRKYLEV